MRKRQLLVTAFAFFLSYLYNLPDFYAQSNLRSKEITEAVDSIFADKMSMAAPGASIIIMKGESVLLAKNYGTANLVFGVPFDENTIFPLEGFTEQLVVFSILQLEIKGLVNLDDSVNKYLPKLGFPARISISHLMNHSSGFPMISSLRLMAGWNFSDAFTHDDFLGLAKKATFDLHPDRKFSHNHGGIKFLMMVVEKVSGNTFSEYAASNIFIPLGMTNTSVRHEGYRDNKNSSVGYIKADAGYMKVVPIQFDVICPITYSTQPDFQKWMANVQSKKFNGDIIERMNESLTINGKLQERTYGAYCIGQQQYRHYLGQDEFYMRETGNGYSWMWLRLSQAQLSVMVVGNLGTYIGTKVNGVADLLGNYDRPISSDTNDAESVPLDLSEKEMELCKGLYWNEEYLYTTEISIKDGELYHSDEDNGFNFLMTPITKTLFKTPFGGTVEFANLGGSQNKMRNIIPNGRVFDYKQYDVPSLKAGDQLKYEGVYTSDALNVFYRIVWEDNNLILRRTRKPDLKLTPIGDHQFRASEVDFRLIEFNEDVDGIFQKMNISNTGLKNIAFRKL